MHASPRAIELHRREVRRQYAQAIDNVDWLSSECPKYSCGTPVSKYDVANLLHLNQDRIKFIESNQSQHIEGIK